MKEVGKVTKVDGDEVVVKVTRREECSKCGLCGMKENMDGTSFNCKSSLKVSVGDTVAIELQDGGKLTASILVFLVPLICLAIAILISYALSVAEIWIFAICLSVLVLWYTILAFIDKKISKISKFVPKIVEVVQKGEEVNE